MTVSPGTLILIYCLGGITFLPLLILSIFLSVYLQYRFLPDKSRLIKFDVTSPEEIQDQSNYVNDQAHTRSKDEDNANLNKVGWLRVTREFQSNGGATNNGSSFGNMMKQGIYSFMEKHGPPKRPKDAYFAVLKYNTLFMYESEDQTECKGIIIVSHHDVSIYPELLPDNEIYLKSSSIRLTKKQSICADMEKDIDNRDYYLFCDVAVDKEDWYFALQKSSKLKSNSPGPQPQVVRDKAQFDQAAMSDLLKTIHSDDEHYKTQWLNAILGRIFLGIYKTQTIQDYFVKKLVKKIKKVKKPSFLGDIHIKSVHVGSGVPLITNPKLGELAPNGDLSVDINLDYTGGFRVEIETEATVSFSRFKTIKVPLVLAVVLRRLQGKLLLRIKAPPSNRIWMGFHEMPKLDLLIEPVVSTTQLKFSMVIKAIESKIQEMIMESLVLPNMDDTPFFMSSGMGGIYGGDHDSSTSTESMGEKVDKNQPTKPPGDICQTDSVKQPSSKTESLDVSTTPVSLKNKLKSKTMLPELETTNNQSSKPPSILTKGLPSFKESNDDASSVKSAPGALDTINALDPSNDPYLVDSPSSAPSKFERWSRSMSIRRRSSRMGIAGILANDEKSEEVSKSSPIPIVTISATQPRNKASAVSSENSSPSGSPLGSPSGSLAGSPSSTPQRNSPSPTLPPSPPKSPRSAPTQLLFTAYPSKKSEYASSCKSLPIIRDSSDENEDIFFSGQDVPLFPERKPILDPPVEELNMVLG
ncbi:10563_t:CDS:2 [Ambispora leptoticha]|uniref:10563_t:CDS:1 n=1 Tax=Ambispora leptoticha TaxID=144679 RepID=A0A9N9AKJ4_9GLOM|nr:10563_t:CDS:2 [Ambispora leptoticha]